MVGRDLAFWDTSGIVLLCVPQRDASRALAVRRTSPPGVLWWGTRLEVRSALARLVREQVIDDPGRTAAWQRYERIEKVSRLVEPAREVLDLASVLVDDHPLRAGDALQLAAALSLVRGKPKNRVFVAFDIRLAAVARDVGFDVRP